jgi:hypothetical protein
VSDVTYQLAQLHGCQLAQLVGLTDEIILIENENLDFTLDIVVLLVAIFKVDPDGVIVENERFCYTKSYFPPFSVVKTLIFSHLPLVKTPIIKYNGCIKVVRL